MTARPTAPSRRGSLLVVGLLVAGVAGAGLWYLFLRPAGPPPVSLASLPPGSAAPSVGSMAGPSGDPSDEPAAAGLDGTWSVDPSVGSFDDFSGSFVGYRVREELATVGATEAVGRTPDVSGTLTLEGTRITAVEITADLTTLRSDERMRDGQLSRQGLETSQFPSATFRLTTPIDLGSLPAEGQAIEATATGELTLHGQTRSVEVPVQARLQGGVITVAGSLPIVFADFGMERPRAMIVLSVEDRGTMELQLHFTRA